MRNKYRAKPTAEGEQVPDTARARKLRFNVADVPQPVKERELRYEDYSHNREGLLLQWGNRLHALSNDREAWRQELDAMVARRGCAPE